MSNESEGLLRDPSKEVIQPRSKLMITGLTVLAVVSGIFAISLLLASHGLATPVIASIGHGLISALGAAFGVDMLIGIFTTISALSLFAGLAEIIRPGSVKRFFTKIADSLKALNHKINSLLSAKWNPFLDNEGKFSRQHYLTSLKTNPLLTLGKTLLYPFAYLVGFFYLGGEAIAKKSIELFQQCRDQVRDAKAKLAKRLRKRGLEPKTVPDSTAVPQPIVQPEGQQQAGQVTPVVGSTEAEANSEAVEKTPFAKFAKLVEKERSEVLAQTLARKNNEKKRAEDNSMKPTQYMQLESLFDSLTQQQKLNINITDEEIVKQLTEKATELLNGQKAISPSSTSGIKKEEDPRRRFGEALIALGMFQRLQAGKVKNNNQFLYVPKPQVSAN